MSDGDDFMKYHFTPAKGWMNDPNGTIYINGEYHLFFQHYPDDIIWGPMHWGHAKSKDLVRWEELPIALYPDELGYVFSGCCVLDEEGVAGFGKNALVAMYTSHDPVTGNEQQSIYYSNDYIHFTAYEGNPVIANTPELSSYKKDFRDPKVFKNPVKGGYTCALAASDTVDFYHSYDLLHWNKTGEFNAQENGLRGICECPDCLYVDGHWVLFISKVIDKEYLNKPLEEQGYKIRHTMEYYIGEFDGDKFIDTQKCNTPLLLDYGPDNYAMVSFGRTEPPVLIGWGESWEYVRKSPATTYRGKATLAKRVKVVETERGLRLAILPYSNVPVNEYLVTDKLELNKLTIKVTEEVIEVYREIADFCEFIEEEKHNYFMAKRYTSGPCKISIIEDEGYYEIYAEDGLIPISIQTY